MHLFIYLRDVYCYILRDLSSLFQPIAFSVTLFSHRIHIPTVRRNVIFLSPLFVLLLIIQAPLFFQFFRANSDDDTVVKNDLPSPVISKFIRIYPTAWNGDIALRLEIKGCLIPQSMQFV